MSNDGVVLNRILHDIVDAESIRPLLREVSLVMGQVLYEADSPIDHIFFIESGIVSITALTGDNAQVEIGLIGRDGFVGTSALLSPQAWSAHRAFVQAPGSAQRMTTTNFSDSVDRSVLLRGRCLRFVDFALSQTGQIAACNARHTVQQRLARWLLMARKLLDTDVLPMTQEFLSIMLGVRRTGVSVAASALQRNGLIQVSRGTVHVIDFAGLVASSCNCYQIIEQSQRRILDVE